MIIDQVLEVAQLKWYDIFVAFWVHEKLKELRGSENLPRDCWAWYLFSLQKCRDFG